MPGIGVILNPFSKKYKKNPEKAQRMGFIVGDKASCKATQDLQDLRRVAEEFKSRDIDILAISGGDGTIHCSLTTFIQIYGDKPLPKICLLKGGTVNTIASNLKIKGSSEKILSDLLVKYHEDIPFETQSLQVTKINDEYGLIFGIGTANRFMEAYYENGTPSPTHAAVLLMKCVSSSLVNGEFTRKMFAPFEAEVEMDGIKWPFNNYSNILTASIVNVGLGSKVMYQLIDNPYAFQAIGTNCTPRHLGKQVAKFYFGKPKNSPHIIEQAGKKLTIKLKKPIHYMIDGDMKSTSDYFELTTGPHLTVVIP